MGEVPTIRNPSCDPLGPSTQGWDRTAAKTGSWRGLRTHWMWPHTRQPAASWGSRVQPCSEDLCARCRNKEAMGDAMERGRRPGGLGAGQVHADAQTDGEHSWEDRRRALARGPQGSVRGSAWEGRWGRRTEWKEPGGFQSLGGASATLRAAAQKASAPLSYLSKAVLDAVSLSPAVGHRGRNAGYVLSS